MESYYQQSLCINCPLCYAACPAYGLHSDFLGPAAIALTYRYNNDSRDQGREERRKVVADGNGVWKCPVVGDCPEVCPEHVVPETALFYPLHDQGMEQHLCGPLRHLPARTALGIVRGRGQVQCPAD